MSGMSQWLMALILISSGIGLGLLCFIAGAWIMFRARREPGSGDSLFRSPKGEAFTIRDAFDDVEGFPPGGEEPSEEQRGVLARTNKFLEVLGGKQ